MQLAKFAIEQVPSKVGPKLSRWYQHQIQVEMELLHRKTPSIQMLVALPPVLRVDPLLRPAPRDHRGPRQTLNGLQADPDLRHQVHLPPVVVNPIKVALQHVETKNRKPSFRVYK